MILRVATDHAASQFDITGGSQYDPDSSGACVEKMHYRLLADLVLIVHAAFVAFVMLGGLAALRWPRAAWVHLPVALWGAGIEFVGGICPLTPLENHWRELAGDQGYAGGFVEHYIVALLYPDGLTRTIQVALGLFVVVVNVAVYAYAWRRR